jgi:hypothetical protein
MPCVMLKLGAVRRVLGRGRRLEGSMRNEGSSDTTRRIDENASPVIAKGKQNSHTCYQ